MNEVVLVAGSESLTGRKLIEKLLARGSQVIAPVVGRETEKNETGTANLTVLTWNRSSWFSTKTVVREALRLHGRIDAGILIHRHTPSREAFTEAGSGEIEDVLEQSIKGSVALVRELIPVLGASSGFLGMVVPHRSGGEPGPLDALAGGAFSGFASALVRESPLPLWSCGFHNTSPDAEGFADTIIRLHDERPDKLRGRWYRYSSGRRPFGGSSITDSI